MFQKLVQAGPRAGGWLVRAAGASAECFPSALGLPDQVLRSPDVSSKSFVLTRMSGCPWPPRKVDGPWGFQTRTPECTASLFCSDLREQNTGQASVTGGKEGRVRLCWGSGDRPGGSGEKGVLGGQRREGREAWG